MFENNKLHCLLDFGCVYGLMLGFMSIQVASINLDVKSTVQSCAVDFHAIVK